MNSYLHVVSVYFKQKYIHLAINPGTSLEKPAVQNHVAVRNEKQSITGFALSLLAVPSTAGALLLRTICTGKQARRLFYCSVWYMAKNGMFRFF